jgi:DNA polymerase type B, organellar and viral
LSGEEEKTPMRRCDYDVHKAGGIVSATFRGPAVFREACATDPLPVTSICSIDTESLKKDGALTTLLVPMHFHDRSVLLETPNGAGMLEQVFGAMWRQGWAEEEERPSRTAQRSKRGRGGTHRDGERQRLEPRLAVFFNFPYDLGRLLADRPNLLRTVASGAESYSVDLSPEWQFEVRRMILGTAPSFDWRIRNRATKTAVRLLGIDMVGYWKASLASVSKALGVKEKIDIESQIEGIYEMDREAITGPQWEMFRQYATGDTQSTAEVYHRTCALLITVDARVVRKTGVIPPSAPGASARMVFAKAFDCHPDLKEWKRYPAWADQMGCASYYGGRSFCRKPGIWRRMKSFDLKSAYPAVMAQLPDPVTVRMSRVSEGRFVPEWYRGRFGVLCISGCENNDTMPAFRTHDASQGGRLKYVAGPFERAWVTIPEIVIGHLRGTLTVSHVHDGVVMVGSSEKSFIRAGIAEFFRIKEDARNERALQNMGKLLANSLYGKFIEVTCVDYLVGEEIVMQVFLARAEVARSIALIFACSGLQPADRLYWGESEGVQKLARHEYRRVAEKLVIPTERDAATNAIYAYVEALAVAGEPSTGATTSVGRYVASHKHYKCGQYFFPLYASQITGLTSAEVGLMAECLDAWQGDTDSVHYPLPEGVPSGDLLPGFERYFAIMAEAGYLAPRRTADGSFKNPILEESPILGCWEDETPAPSEESLLIRPKLYSHRFPDGGFKQAKHGFAKFHTPEVETVLRDMSLGRDERIKKANRIRAGEQHRAMRAVYEKGYFEYMTRPAPLKLRTAIKSGRNPGQFESRLMKMMATTDPNNYLGEDGFVHWGDAPTRMEEVG